MNSSETPAISVLLSMLKETFSNRNIEFIPESVSFRGLDFRFKDAPESYVANIFFVIQKTTQDGLVFDNQAESLTNELHKTFKDHCDLCQINVGIKSVLEKEVDRLISFFIENGLYHIRVDNNKVEMHGSDYIYYRVISPKLFQSFSLLR